jgi:mRNA interferase RelE/StbE
MEVYYTRKAKNDLVGLPKNIQKRIVMKIYFYSRQENPLKFAKPLKNSLEGQFRFRIGDYRVFFDLIENKIFILNIKHRSKYY